MLTRPLIRDNYRVTYGVQPKSHSTLDEFLQCHYKASIPGEPKAERWCCDAHDPLNLNQLRLAEGGRFSARHIARKPQPLR